MKILRTKSKDLRLIKINVEDKELFPKKHYRFINGALLEQGYDDVIMERFEVVTKKQLSDNKENVGS